MHFHTDLFPRYWYSCTKSRWNLSISISFSCKVATFFSIPPPPSPLCLSIVLNHSDNLKLLKARLLRVFTQPIPPTSQYSPMMMQQRNERVRGKTKTKKTECPIEDNYRQTKLFLWEGRVGCKKCPREGWLIAVTQYCYTTLCAMSMHRENYIVKYIFKKSFSLANFSMANPTTIKHTSKLQFLFV